ncbi:hypothetical protein F4803DRAFT_552888 [Xylaria telfairii]|nr:hypothetical protein F4803DRAFT_552888 [Xylaria telfairii]
MSITTTTAAPAKDDAIRWYDLGTKSIPAAMGEILLKWSEIPENQVMEHVSKLRSQAFQTYPYPCIGQSRFLNVNISDHVLYPKIISSLKNGSHSFLDAGCCFGQELRKLAFDKAPPETLYGIDLEPSFIELGFDLFQDRRKMANATFIAGDLLDPDKGWPELKGNIDFILTNSLFHLFPRPEQMKVACQLVSFSRAQSGSLIFGRQVGSAVPGEFRALTEGNTYFRHSPQSLENFWHEVGQLTGTSWKTEAYLDMTDLNHNKDYLSSEEAK